MTYAIVLAAYYFVQTCYMEGAITKLDYTVAAAAQRLVTYIARPFLRKPAIVSWLARISTAISDSDLFYKILLAFTDQQLITGLSILITGYVQTKTISQYHFSIVQNMANLSFTVHGAAAHMLEDNVLQNPAMRTWRGLAIICFQLMVLVTYIPIGHDYWMTSYGMPTVCIWKNMHGHYSIFSLRTWEMVFWGIILVRGIVCTLHAYFPRTHTWRWVRDNTVGSRIDSLPRNTYNASIVQSNDSLTPSWLSRSGCTLKFVVTEIFWSQAFELQRSWVIIIGSIYSTFELRSKAIERGREGDEDAWGFGQAVPMFLLILPLALIWETGYGTYSGG